MASNPQEAVKASTLIDRFPDLLIEVIGDSDRKVARTSAPELAHDDSVVFVSTPRHLEAGLKSAARVLVVSKKLRDAAAKSGDVRTILVSPNVELALARITNEFFLATPYTNKGVVGIQSSAFVDPSASLGRDVRISHHAFVGAHVRLGDHVFIGANAVIEDHCEIGSGSVIHPLAYIGHSTLIGMRCEVHPQTTIGKEGFGYAHNEKGEHIRIPHQGRVVLEDDVHVGAAVAIDRGTFNETRIGAGTKIDNNVHIAHNCSFGKNGLITAGFIIAGSSAVGANFVAGGNTVVTGHLKIADNVQLAGMSGVSKSIEKAGAYGGYPLQPLKDFLRTKAAIVKVALMRKQLRTVLETLSIVDQPDADTDSGADF